HPVQNDKWARSNLYQIEWTKTCIENVRIDLCDTANQVLLNIKISAPGTFTPWFIPSALAIGRYKIMITSVLDPDNIKAYSGTFNVTQSTGGLITILHPEANENWNKGATHGIEWNKPFSENVRIDLCNPSNGLISNIKPSVSGGSFIWYIPSTFITGAYKIKMSSVLDPSNVSFSGVFNITESSGGAITIIHPVAGENWNKGNTHNIEWNKPFSENLRIDLCNVSNGVLINIKPSVSGSSFTWYIPSTFKSGTYKIKLSSVLDPSIMAFSGVFSISEVSGGTISIFHPVAGENWNKGATHNIVWHKPFSENVRIDLCNSSYLVLLNIKPSVSDTFFTWYIPSTYVSDAYMIRISSVLDTSNVTFSGVFNITGSKSAEEEIIVTSPVKGSAFSYTVFPNPVIGNMMTIKFDDFFKGSGSIEMFDRYGRIVFKESFNVEYSNEISLPTGNMCNDLYFLVVTAGDDRILKKVIIQH
ncbi:MAG: Ser-Thr-rich GPI-anchored membrane family protein, partial [Bacteroidota bacterium]